MKSAGDMWSGIEGERAGNPVLARVRQIRAPEKLRKAFPVLFAIEWAYRIQNRSGLPSAALYRRLEAFEEKVIDAIEREGEGVLVLVETSAGTVRYLLYVAAAETIAGRINAEVSARTRLTLSERRDARWSEYRAISKALLENDPA